MNIRNILSISRNIPHKKILFILIPLLILGIFVSAFAYGFANHAPAKKVAVHPTPTATPSPTPSPDTNSPPNTNASTNATSGKKYAFNFRDRGRP